LNGIAALLFFEKVTVTTVRNKTGNTHYDIPVVLIDIYHDLCCALVKILAAAKALLFNGHL